MTRKIAIPTLIKTAGFDGSIRLESKGSPLAFDSHPLIGYNVIGHSIPTGQRGSAAQQINAVVSVALQ